MANDQYQAESHSLSFPTDTVVGLVDEPDGAEAAVRDLVEAGIPEEKIEVLCCEAGARRLDPAGERHGLLGRLQRVVQHYGDREIHHVKRQASELEAGNFLIAAPAEGRGEREAVASILRSHGGHFINHYGEWTVTQLEE